VFEAGTPGLFATLIPRAGGVLACDPCGRRCVTMGCSAALWNAMIVRYAVYRLHDVKNGRRVEDLMCCPCRPVLGPQGWMNRWVFDFRLPFAVAGYTGDAVETFGSCWTAPVQGTGAGRALDANRL